MLNWNESRQLARAEARALAGSYVECNNCMGDDPNCSCLITKEAAEDIVADRAYDNWRENHGV